MRFEVGFFGHPCVRATHQTTLELTRSSSLTPAGDCIVGVSASRGCAGLPDQLKARLREPGARVRFSLSAGQHKWSFEGRGGPKLILSDPDDIVARTSDYVCPRTLAVGCTRAADSVPRSLVRLLQDPTVRGTLTIEVKEK